MSIGSSSVRGGGRKDAGRASMLPHPAGVDPLIVDMNGGAIALGHPIGATGTRIVGHVARSLAALGPGGLGIAATCGGGGQGAALFLESVEA